MSLLFYNVQRINIKKTGLSSLFERINEARRGGAQLIYRDESVVWKC